MAQAGRNGGVWHSLRDLPARTPLRVKLITALLTLVAIALLVISVAGIGFLKSYLVGPINGQLYAAAVQGQPVVGTAIATGTKVSGPSSMEVDWYPLGGKPRQISTPGPSHGRYFYGPGGSAPGPQISPGATWLASGQPTAVSAASGQGVWQVLSAPLTNASGQVTGYVIYAWDATSVYHTIHKLETVDWIVSVLLLLGLAIVGVAVIRASLRPLVDIEQTAGAIAAGDLSRRVPERDPRTEVGRLGRSLNVMLSQIESAFHAQSRSEESARRSEEKMRQFVADASHELRTPLTAIRGFAEYYRQRGGIDTGHNGTGKLAPADLDRIMRRVEQEASRMGILVEDMLLLARIDQQRPLEVRPVDLLSLAADAVHDARVVAPSRSINLTVSSGAALLVIGDEVRLRQVIGNLMSNALSHTPDGTPIDVLIRSGNLDEAPSLAPPPPPAMSTDTGAGAAEPVEFTVAGVPADDAVPARVYQGGSQPAAVLEVTDHGPGLTREQASHVFERFYRADQARTSGGTGLGLAIVAALVAAHGGVTWVRSQPGQGATFCIALPLSPDAVHGSDDDFADADDSSDEIDVEHDADWTHSDSDQPQARATAAPGHATA